MHTKKELGKGKASPYLLAVEDNHSLSRVLIGALPAHCYLLSPWPLSLAPFKCLVNSAMLLHAF